MARLVKPDVFSATFADDQQIVDLLAALGSKRGEPNLAYSSCADKRVLYEMEIEILRRIALGEASGSIGGIGLVFRRTTVTSPSSTFVIDVPAIRKAVGRLKGEYPNSISRGVIFPTLAGNELAFTVGTVSLVMSRDAEDVPRMAATMSAAAVSLPPDQWAPLPNHDAVGQIVAKFQKAHVDLRRLAGETARSQDRKRWALLRQKAVIQLRIADVLTPLKKTIVGVGYGSEILNHAFTGPEARAKRAGKNGFSREEVTDRFWRHALEARRIAPPFIKL